MNVNTASKKALRTGEENVTNGEAPSTSGREAVRLSAETIKNTTQRIVFSGMDREEAAQLLATERKRIDQALGGLDAPLEGDDRVEPGDEGSEELYQDEYDQGRREDLQKDLARLERAEARLAEGTYGLSVDSGEPIPDDRLRALPTAERTIEEEERFRRAGG